jgi:replicative DNA helicase
MDDPRPDQLLEECGRIASRLRLAVAWTDGIKGGAAKVCSRGGAAAWKRAKPLPENEETAAGFFKTRARRRNPAVVASASGLVLMEADGDLEKLLARHGVPILPPTLTVRSRRGRHLYFRPPPGRQPLKVQVAEDGIASSLDGYLIGAPALHETGWVYRYENGTRALVELPTELYDLIVRASVETREWTWHALESGKPIPTGSRNDAIFHAALGMLHAGGQREDVLRELLRVNAEQCQPPLDERLVHKQLAGAAKWVRTNPSAEEALRAKARQALIPRRREVHEREPAVHQALAWDEPVPLATRGTAPPFRLETLPDWLAAWVLAITTEKGAVLDLGGNLALDVISGAIARHVQVSPRPGWYEPTCLYTIVALAPGQRKSPLFKGALRPVRTLEAQRLRDFRETDAIANLASKIRQKRERELIDEADEEADPEQLRERLESFVGEIGLEEAPVRPRLLTEDVTPEGLAALLADHGRIIAASDEGAALFENLAGRYARGSTSWDILNKSHSAADLVVDRKGSEPVIVYDPALTLAIATQPELLRTLASKPGVEGRGVLARPLYVLPEPVYVQGATPAADPEVLEEYARRVRAVYNDTPDLETDEDEHPRPLVLTFDPVAREMFERFELELNEERRRLGGDDLDGESVYLGWLSKLAGQTARLAAVLHAAAHWTGGYGASLVKIDETTAQRAIALAHYYRAHALSVFGLMGELPGQGLAASILRWLAARDPAELEALTVRDVHRSRSKGTSATRVRVALGLLEDHGYVRIERERSGRQGGRPSERVRVNPAVHAIPRKTPDIADKTPVLSGMSGELQVIPKCEKHPEADAWLARDGIWRCRECEPPSFSGEVVGEAR